MNATDPLVLGRAHWDVVAHAEHLTPGSDAAGTVTREIGGVAARLACALAAHGSSPTLVAAVGGDRPGNELAETLHRCGVALDPVGCPATGSYVALETPEGLHAAVSAPAVPDAGSLTDAAVDRWSPGHLLVADTSLPVDDLRWLLARRPSVIPAAVVVTNLSRVAPAAVLRGMVDVSVHMNLDEAAELLAALGDGGGCPARSVEAAERLLTAGMGHVTVTDGPRPAAAGLVRDGVRTTWEAEPPEQSVARVTGAGDAFAAAYISGARLGAQDDPADALAAAVRSAAAHVGGV